MRGAPGGGSADGVAVAGGAALALEAGAVAVGAAVALGGGSASRGGVVQAAVLSSARARGAANERRGNEFTPRSVPPFDLEASIQ